VTTVTITVADSETAVAWSPGRGGTVTPIALAHNNKN
jgi:hypothetical protein